MSLRSILGGSSRVKKSKKPAASSSSSFPSVLSPSQAWAASLPRRKPGSNGKTAAAAKNALQDATARHSSSSSHRHAEARGGVRRGPEDKEEEGEEDYFHDAPGDDHDGDGPLDDLGLVRTLATDLGLRDTAQAVRHVRAHMFTPMPQRGPRMGSERTAEILNYRRRLPPLVAVAHVQTLLASPSAVEREAAELARAGVLRRVVVPRRAGAIGEALILASDYDRLLQEAVDGGGGEVRGGGGGKEAPTLSADARDALLRHLRDCPGGGGGSQAVPPAALQPAHASQLLKAGFVTAHHTGGGGVSGVVNAHARPEDRGTLTSLETVSRQPTGSLGTVGGEGAVFMAGGSGGGGGSAAAAASPATELRLAVPGHGAYLKLVSAALDYLTGTLLGKGRGGGGGSGSSSSSSSSSRHLREAPESVLRERWDCGGVSRADAAFADPGGNRAKHGFGTIPPGHTRKWRQFHGLSFDWVLREAVGAGLVEVFETGSVGRGVRAVR